jgi:hypothetical protein
MRAWWSRRRQSQRQRVAQDAIRVRGYMAAVLTDARRVDAPARVDAASALAIWRNWTTKLEGWAEQKQ